MPEFRDTDAPTEAELNKAEHAASIAITACEGCGMVHVYLYDKKRKLKTFINVSPDDWLDLIEPVDEVLMDILEDEKDERSGTAH